MMTRQARTKGKATALLSFSVRFTGLEMCLDRFINRFRSIFSCWVRPTHYQALISGSVAFFWLACLAGRGGQFDHPFAINLMAKGARCTVRAVPTGPWSVKLTANRPVYFPSEEARLKWLSSRQNS